MPSRDLSKRQIVIVVVDYKPIINKDTRTERHPTVKKTGMKSLTDIFEDEVHLPDEYASYREKLLTMPIEYWNKWNGHMGQIYRKTLHQVHPKK